MHWFRRRKEREQDLERELRSHLELESEEQREAGLPAEETRYTAQRTLGNIALIKEDSRAMWGCCLSVIPMSWSNSCSSRHDAPAIVFPIP